MAAAPIVSARPSGTILISIPPSGAFSFFDEPVLARVGRDLAMEHCKDQLPVALCGLLVVDVPVRQRVAMLRTLVNRVRVSHLARFEQRTELLHHRQRCVVIELCKAAIMLAAQFGDAEMRGVR